MSEKVLFIHIGFGKTGTTAIQDCLLANRAHLIAQGLCYPRSATQDNGGHHALAVLGQESLTSQTLRELDRLKYEINNSGCNRAVISSENLCFMKDTYVSALFNELKEFKIKLIFSVREQSNLIESSFLERIKTNGQPPYKNVNDFWHQHRYSFDFMHRLNNFRRFISDEDIIVKLFDKRIFINGNFINNFIDIFHIDRKYIHVSQERANTSLIPELANIAQNINSKCDTTKERKANIDNLMEISNKFRKFSESKLINDQLKENIYTFYKGSNTKLASTFLHEKDYDLFKEICRI